MVEQGQCGRLSGRVGVGAPLVGAPLGGLLAWWGSGFSARWSFVLGCVVCPAMSPVLPGLSPTYISVTGVSLSAVWFKGVGQGAWGLVHTKGFLLGVSSGGLHGWASGLGSRWAGLAFVGSVFLDI